MNKVNISFELSISTLGEFNEDDFDNFKKELKGYLYTWDSVRIKNVKITNKEV